MAETLQTVTIVSPDDPEQMSVINADDFDPEKHTLWEDKDKPKAPARKSVIPDTSENPITGGAATTPGKAAYGRPKEEVGAMPPPQAPRGPVVEGSPQTPKDGIGTTPGKEQAERDHAAGKK